MTEYISKSDAVFAACKVLDTFGGCHMGPFCPDSGCKEVRDIINNVPAADVVERPRWIPVTERLPDESGNYLTAFGDGRYMAVNEFMHPRGWSTEEGRKAHPNGKWYWGDVTHWMPLPEPPKEKDNG